MPLNIALINQSAYATDAVRHSTNGIKLKKTKCLKIKQPRWKEKLQKDTQYLSILTETEKGVKVEERQQGRMKKKYVIEGAQNIPEIREKLKQQILPKSQRVRRYVKRGEFFRQNKLSKG